MASHTLAPFPAELLAAKKQIREQARSYGLDFFPVIFEMCDGRSVPRYRRVLGYGLILAGLLWAGCAVILLADPGQKDVVVMGLCVAVVVAVVRWQHVRIL